LIRQYNNSLAFVSFGAEHIANASHYTNNKNGPYCMRVDGQIYHKISNNVYTDVDTNASYSQLYVLDNALAHEIRLKHQANKRF